MITQKTRLSPQILSGIITLTSLLLWYPFQSEAEPWSILPGKQESTRFYTLRHIADAANKGYYYQLDPGIPMEHEWEDQGQYFLLVTWGIIKKTVGLGPIDPFVDPYRVEMFVILIPLLLLFFTRLFSLPRWYWILPPLFFLWALVPKYPLGWEHINKVNGLLYLSISTRWVKVLSGFWTFTIGIQIFQWWKEGVLLLMNRGRILRWFAMGFILGLFMSIRKDIWVTSGFSVASSFLLLAWVAPASLNHSAAVRRPPISKIVSTLLIILFLMGWGAISYYRGVICTALTLRDKSYTVKEVSRYYGRNTWHSLCASLGVVKNKYGLVWGDAEVSAIVQELPENKKKGITYGTVEYDKACRRFYFQLITQDPDLLIRNLKFRAGQIWMDHHNGFTRSFILIFLLLFISAYHRWLGIILLSGILSHTVILLIVNHWLHYGLDLVTHYRLAQMIGAGACLYKLWDICRHIFRQKLLPLIR